jgi:hypothetical protein
MDYDLKYLIKLNAFKGLRYRVKKNTQQEALPGEWCALLSLTLRCKYERRAAGMEWSSLPLPDAS